MFSRRHYRIIAMVLAELIATSRNGICPRALIAAFARALEHDNPRFNRAAFERAVGWEDR